MGKLRETVDLARKVVRLLGYSSRRLSVVVAIAMLLEAGLIVGSLYVLKRLVDFVQGSVAAEGRFVVSDGLLTELGIAAVVMLGAAVMQTLAAMWRTQQGLVVSDYVNQTLQKRAIAVDLAFYESPRYFDSLERARQAGPQRPAMVVENALTVIRSGLVLSGALIMIASIDWRIVPVLAALLLAALGIQLYFTRALFVWQRDRAQMERRAAYFDWMLTTDQYAKEVRLFDLGAHFSSLYAELRARIRSGQIRIHNRRAVVEATLAALGTGVFFGATGHLAFAIAEGWATVGDLAMFLLLFRRAETGAREFTRATAKLYDDQLFLRQIFDFLETRPVITAPPGAPAPQRPTGAGLRFEGVDFRYPGSDRLALKGVDFALEPGRVTALVGANGSGKTSLIKLMCRLYDPDAGRVTLDGVDVRDFDLRGYRALFSVIFQDYARYAASVAENIRLGDLRAPHDPERVVAAARRAGADGFIEALPAGYDTLLTRIFDDGREISAGQWQRVALARAFFPDSAFIILDEPTSSVDPNAELAFFKNFRERIGDRGALIISHRLSTIRLADMIYVLQDGSIVESGTHNELISHNGAYARMFLSQARSYNADTVFDGTRD